MNPAEFYAAMRQIQESSESPETKHARMDTLMCELLQSLGYSEGVEVFENK